MCRLPMNTRKSMTGLLCGGIWCIVQLDYEVEGDNNFGIEDIDGNPLSF